ncbi:hypothetical protein ANCDUO_19317, partial [Ancylostoma duodenale]
MNWTVIFFFFLSFLLLAECSPLPDSHSSDVRLRRVKRKKHWKKHGKKHCCGGGYGYGGGGGCMGPPCGGGPYPPF